MRIPPFSTRHKSWAMYISLPLILLSLHPNASNAQACAMSPLRFGVVAPGHVYHVDKFSTDAICISSTTITGRHLVKIGAVTTMTNGVDTVPLTFSQTDASVRVQTTVWSSPIVFDPNTGYMTPFSTRGVEVRLGGSINVPYSISPGQYTGYVRLDIIRQ